MRNRPETKRKRRDDVVRVEDLAPRKGVQGGGKLRFGERRESVTEEREPKPPGLTRSRP